ncbi:MAG: zf-HC2 domain-containing protein [Candidatus Polarisedimenticolia bacterium]
MSDHADYQIELPAYAADRLDDGGRARIEAHMAACGECREMVAAFGGLAAAIQKGGASLFGPHPTEADLRRMATSPGPVEPGLRHHLAVCVSCSLELGGWKRVARSKAARARTSWWGVGVAAAAGVVAGLGLAILLTQTPWQGASMPGPALGATTGPQLLLPPVLRGEPGRAAYDLSPAQQTVVVSWPAAIPDDAPQDERFLFEIGRPGVPASWSLELSAAEIRRHLEATEVVTFLLPAGVLPPGRYEARVIRAGAGGPPLYFAVVEVRAPGHP